MYVSVEPSVSVVQMAPKCPTRPIDEYYDDEDVSEEEVEDVQYPPPPPPPFAYPYHR